jgi:hypothetical protein
VNTQDPAPSESEEPLIEPEVPLRTADFAALDTDRILRETGSIPLPPETAQATQQQELPLTQAPEVPLEGAEAEGLRLRSGMNILAIISLILAIALSPFAVVFGYLAVGQARRSQQRGEAVAWVAVGIGWLWVVGYVILGAIVFVGWQQVFSP